jgi:hypothetical protein
MPGKERCKEHFQGDRCRKQAQHESPVALKPDPVHLGTFSAWEGSGDAKRIVAVSHIRKPHLKRNRALNRFLAKTASQSRLGLRPDAATAAQLGICAKLLRGENPHAT